MNSSFQHRRCALFSARTRPWAALAALALFAWPAAAQTFRDPLQTPATMSLLAPKSPLLAVAAAGERVVAVGQRGHIVYSDDGGKQWTQASVPVSSDLVAVSFPSPKKGWAVGHGGVVLHTEDAGQTWTRQLSGSEASQIAAKFYAQTSATAMPERVRQQAKAQLDEAERGAPGPFFDVSFDDETTGYIVGAFNRIFRTADGGKTWTPWADRIDNPKELHFYAIRGRGDQRYIVGEQGWVWRLDSKAERFTAVRTPYTGTLFGAVVAPSAVLVFGMNGAAFRSDNGGQSWDKVSITSRAALNSGDILPNGQIALVNQAGQLLLSADLGKRFEPVSINGAGTSYFGISGASRHGVGVVGLNGIKVVAVPTTTR